MVSFPVTKVDSASVFKEESIKTPVDTQVAEVLPASIVADTDKPIGHTVEERPPQDLSVTMRQQARRLEIEQLLEKHFPGFKARSEVETKEIAEATSWNKASEWLQSSALATPFAAIIKGLLDGTLKGDDNGDLVATIWPFPLPRPIFFNSFGESKIAVWPSGRAVRVSECVIGCGQEKTVYLATDLQNGKKYAAAFIDGFREIEIQTRLKNKRGIAQIHSDTAVGILNRKYKNLFFVDLYDKDLRKGMDALFPSHSKEDLSKIVKDLLYAIMALEEEDSDQKWVRYSDIKFGNVFLEVDSSTHRVKGAFLGDFGSASLVKEVVLDEEALKEHMEKFGCVMVQRKIDQRSEFVQFIFSGLKKRLNHNPRVKPTSLEDLCADDPLCKTMMAQMEKDFDHIFNRHFVDWVD